MKYNIENRIKDTALINLVDFENAIDLYEDGEVEKALELMFGVTTLGLGGKFETDDKEIRRLLKNREYTAEKSNKAYCNKVKTDEEKRIEKLQLKEIADMLSNGVTQQVIADTLGVSLRTVAYRIGIMKAEFPSLYSVIAKSAKECKQMQNNANEKEEEKEKNAKSAKECKQMQYNDNVNDNVNVNDNEKEKEKEKTEKPKNLNDNVNVNVNDNVNEKKDFSYLYDEVACDGYVRKEKKWIDRMCWNFRAMSAQERIEYIETLDFSHEEAEYIVNNILEI